jgi:hypothetical protein
MGRKLSTHDYTMNHNTDTRHLMLAATTYAEQIPCPEYFVAGYVVYCH